MSVTNTISTHLQSTLLKQTTSNATGDAEGSIALEPYLVILSGLDQGKQYHLNLQFNSFGRTGNVDIKLSDDKISRNHGMLILYPDYIVLEDLQSTNGCYINEIKVDKQIVEPHARIRVGNTIMKIEYKKASEVELEKDLYRAANTDVLTNVSNRRAFMIRAQEEISFSKRANNEIAIIMCDVDHFKQTNDKFGHLAGDYVLKELAQLLHTQIREHDILARYGGEEFIMLLRNTDIDSVIAWAERIRSIIEQHPFTFEESNIPTTLSIGICCLSGENIDTLDKMIKSADNALYQAKHNGRNRVEVASS